MQASCDNLMRNSPSGSLMNGIVEVVDGGRLPWPIYDDTDMRNLYYEGYTCIAKVTDLFVFNFFVNILHAGANFPSGWHDRKLDSLPSLLYPKLGDDMTPPGYDIRVYSALFCALGILVARSCDLGMQSRR